jgi:hypothetical protein
MTLFVYIGAAAFICFTIAAVVTTASRLSGRGRHKLPPGGRHAADWAASAADRYVSQIRGQLPRAGCLPPVSPDPAGWDLAAPARPPGPAGDPYTTAEMPALLAAKKVTPAQHADWLEARIYGTRPEMTP